MDTVIVDGQVLLRNGTFTRVSKDDVIARLKESLNVPLSPRELRRADLGRRLLPHAQQFFEARHLDDGEPHYRYNQRE